MSQYFSRTYRGLLIQQTDQGWVVPQLPNWSKGPVSQGPYSTYAIAEHVIDRVLDTSERENSYKKTQSSTYTPVESNSDEDIEYNTSDSTPFSSFLFKYFVVIPVSLFIIIIGFFAYKDFSGVIAGNYNLIDILKAIYVFIFIMWIGKLRG